MGSIKSGKWVVNKWEILRVGNGQVCPGNIIWQTLTIYLICEHLCLFIPLPVNHSLVYGKSLGAAHQTLPVNHSLDLCIVKV